MKKVPAIRIHYYNTNREIDGLIMIETTKEEALQFFHKTYPHFDVYDVEETTEYVYQENLNN